MGFANVYGMSPQNETSTWGFSLNNQPEVEREERPSDKVWPGHPTSVKCMVCSYTRIVGANEVHEEIVAHGKECPGGCEQPPFDEWEFPQTEDED